MSCAALVRHPCYHLTNDEEFRGLALFLHRVLIANRVLLKVQEEERSLKVPYATRFQIVIFRPGSHN